MSARVGGAEEVPAVGLHRTDADAENLRASRRGRGRGRTLGEAEIRALPLMGRLVKVYLPGNTQHEGPLKVDRET